jgi:hypothetical protein
MNRYRPVPASAGIDTRSRCMQHLSRGTFYYHAHLEQDPWSVWVLTQVNGCIGTKLGRAQVKPSPAIENTFLHFAAIAKRRRQRGYELTS